MGLLIGGVWQANATSSTSTDKHDGFHRFITADGSSGFKAEPKRYHLYISFACPWACRTRRTLIFRKLKQLEEVISLSIVDPISAEQHLLGSSLESTV